MVKYIFLTFGNERFYKSLNRIKEQAYSFDTFDEVCIYDDLKLKTDFPDFWKKHGDFIIHNPRGYGYWIWKSFLTLKILEKMNENDILVYADAGCELNPHGKDRLNDYFEIVTKHSTGMLAFQMNHLEKKYTKSDLFHAFNMNTNKCLNSGQIMATTFILKKCNHTLNLINEWYKYSSIYHLIDDSKSIIENDKEFIDHRHDQSIFSLMCKKYGTLLLRDETWHNDWDSPFAKKFPILGKRIRDR